MKQNADDLAKIEASLSFQRNADGPSSIGNLDHSNNNLAETQQEQQIKEELLNK